MGDRFGLTHWSEMMRSVKSAVLNPNNQFRILAPILIKEIKQAQEQVLSQKANQIKVSQQLLQLIPEQMPSKSTTASPVAVKTAISSSSDEVSQIFGAVIEEDKAMKGWQTFSDRVGWRKNGIWIPSNATHSQNEADGHFPIPLWLAGWHQSKDSKAKEFQAQYAALLAKIASCNLP
jgi:chemosensory pili system protein ChpA (sensor histidine kinase/response regulator)